MIHSTAIIEHGANLASDVAVGPYTIIGSKVSIGSGCCIGSHVVIAGKTTISNNNKIHPFASIGGIPQDKKYIDEDTELIIGANNTIREYCTINIGTITGNSRTVIGNNNWIMAYVHIAHDCIIGNNTIIANGVTLAGHVIVKDWAILGGLSPVHQFCIIGEHVMLGGHSGVTQDIPPYSIVAGFKATPSGINSEGLRRRGFTTAQISNIKSAYRILYRNGSSYDEAKTSITDLAQKQPELQPFVDFFAESTRGIIR